MSDSAVAAAWETAERFSKPCPHDPEDEPSSWRYHRFCSLCLHDFVRAAEAAVYERAAGIAWAALKKYGRHDSDCAKRDYYGPDDARCDCGFTAAIRALRAEAKP